MNGQSLIGKTHNEVGRLSQVIQYKSLMATQASHNLTDIESLREVIFIINVYTGKYST